MNTSETKKALVSTALAALVCATIAAAPAEAATCTGVVSLEVDLTAQESGKA